MTKTKYQIATAWDSPIVAVAAWAEPRVAIWDIITRERLTQIDTSLDVGGTLAISEDGRRVITAAYERHGVEAWDTASGERLWQRKDLKKASTIRFLPSSELFVSRQLGASTRLDVETGVEVERFRGVSDLVPNPLGDESYLERSADGVLLGKGGARIGKVEPTSGREIAFSPDRMLIRNPLRCVSLVDGTECWRVDLRMRELGRSQGTGTRIDTWMPGYDDENDTFLVVRGRDPDRHVGGLPWRLLRLRPETGETVASLSVERWPFAEYCLRDSRILNIDGALISTDTGELVHRLDF